MRLNYWLAEKGMTAKKLSEKAGLNYSTVRDIKSGKVKKANPITVRKLANGLGIEVGELLEERVN
jgi:DNA-binding Xre family transcriptional regulator